MKWAMRNCRRLVRDEGGVAAVEFAIVSVAFFAFIFAIAYIGIIMFTNATLQWAVESGSRVAAINQSATQSDISEAINSYLASANAPPATVDYTVSQSGTLKTATISASFSESYSVPLFSTFNIDYNASTSVPLAN